MAAKGRGSGGGFFNAEKTHCKRGHEFTEANTLIKGDGWRYCRECQRTRDRGRVR
jgi:hypothetical protein